MTWLHELMSVFIYSSSYICWFTARSTDTPRLMWPASYQLLPHHLNPPPYQPWQPLQLWVWQPTLLLLPRCLSALVLPLVLPLLQLLPSPLRVRAGHYSSITCPRRQMTEPCGAYSDRLVRFSPWRWSVTMKLRSVKATALSPWWSTRKPRWLYTSWTCPASVTVSYRLASKTWGRCDRLETRDSNIFIEFSLLF